MQKLDTIVQNRQPGDLAKQGQPPLLKSTVDTRLTSETGNNEVKSSLGNHLEELSTFPAQRSLGTELPLNKITKVSMEPPVISVSQFVSKVSEWNWWIMENQSGVFH